MTKTIQAFTMPKWGIEMEEGVIREWSVAEGASVKPGDIVVVIETDKIANEVEAETEAVLRRRLGEEGETYPVGALIGVWAPEDTPDTDVDAFIASFKPVDAGFGDDEAAEASPPGGKNAPIPKDANISPKAAELALKLGVDVTGVEGSGRNGRISLQDIEQAAKAQGLSADAADGDGAENPFRTIKLSAMRRTIAKRLTEAKQTVPHFYLRAEVGVDALTALRARNGASGDPRPSLNDYFIKACAVALEKVPEANVHFAGDEIQIFENADISLAVAVDGGLITPVISAANRKSVEEIAKLSADLIDRARREQLAPAEYKGGTFSLSNLGMYGVASFDAVINPPQGAILAIGAAAPCAVQGADGSATFENRMSVTLSCDHRAIDGAVGARFLAAFKDAVEAPEQLLS